MQNTQEFRYDLLKQILPSLGLKSYDLAATVGLLTPNVFNTPDVLAAEHFVLLERRINGATNWELVPFIGYNGERLEYNSNDLIYYGVSIPLRRCIQVKPLNECSVFVEKVIAYDKSIDKITEADYRVMLQKSKNNFQVDKMNKKISSFQREIDTVFVFYDGERPFSSNFVKMLH